MNYVSFPGTYDELFIDVRWQGGIIRMKGYWEGSRSDSHSNMEITFRVHEFLIGESE